MKILITSGGTSEPVDGVRFLTNFSTGTTGAALARALKRMGHEVLLLRSQRAKNVPCVEQRIFGGFASLDAALKELLSCRDFDLIVHAAAVGDFCVETVRLDNKDFSPQDLPKIPSGLPVWLKLRPTHKIIDRLAHYACNRPIIVGFKLTNAASESQAQSAAARVRADWVVHNDLTDIRAGKRIFTLYQCGVAKEKVLGVSALARWLNGLHKNCSNRC